MKQREIKFRCWDKKKRLMLVGIELKKLLSYLMFQNSPNSEAYDLMKDHFEDIEWLQYTGLLDKKGVEIYEGDIALCFTTDEEDSFNAEVIWSDLHGAWMFEQNKDTAHWRQSIDEIEVIGNIYENKELFK